MKDCLVGKNIKVKITSFGPHGEGKGEAFERKIFIKNALMGEVHDVEIIKTSYDYLIGKSLSLEKESVSSYRVRAEEIACSYYGRCGGCQLMHMTKEGQHHLKEEMVRNSFHEKKLTISLDAIGASPLFHQYRNKVQLPISLSREQKMVIGPFRQNSNDVVDIASCLIHQQIGDDAFKKIKTLLQNIWPEDKVSHLKHLHLRTSEKEKKVLVCLVGRDSYIEVKEILHRLWSALKKENVIAGLFYNHNESDYNAVFSSNFHHVGGQKVIQERVLDKDFSLSCESFFQVNRLQAELIYSELIEDLNLQKSDVVFDAFCGIGTISLLLAEKVSKVYGVEIIEQAINNARENARLNAVQNCEFICGKAEECDYLAEKATVLVVNPPRKGLDKKMVQFIARSHKIKKMVYISCNPATLARDVSMLKKMCEEKKRPFTIKKVKPFDMFPQTAHVETLCSLEF